MFDSRVVLIAIWLVGFAAGQAILPPDEVASLQAIARTLGKTNWDFSVDPCSGVSGWVTPPVKDFANAVTCDCTFANNTVCHVISIILKSQNLSGSVPRELIRLPFLKEIDLSRNYLNGPIPREWGSMKLVNISLLANRVTGGIPVELANISTLANLTLEANQLSGGLPPELGNLSRIEKFQFTSNNFTGEVPASLARLTTLTNVLLGDNNFTGSIPNFIQNWTNIQRLILQGSGLSGPIPPGIGSLINLTDLRISDLSGNVSTFPPLSNMKILKTLILRSCNIIGELPSYIGEMSGIKLLDLTFNKLSGPIPDSFIGLSRTDNIYLTGNSLSGPLPSWMLTDGENIDLSYNNLTSDSSIENCQPSRLNLFASSKGNTTGLVSCLKSSISCGRKYYSFHINCGGKQEVDDKEIQYDDDIVSSGPSNFVLSRSTNWGFSNTGIFLDHNRSKDSLILSNSSAITGPNPQLYMNARISPVSLTYYGFCLSNGNYTVSLHFAEIMFTDDRTYSSLGRRIFDVYIQGELVLKDFNIEKEAGGVNRALRKNVTVVVNDSTLDIRFYWSGKGTNSIPTRGVYGPLISAISVDPNFTPPAEEKGISTGAVIGIVIGAFLAVLLVLGVLWWVVLLRRKSQMRHDLKGLDLKTGSFTLRQIKAATNDFDPATKIGEGGFGPVYKGILLDGTIIAVKQLSSKSNQGNREFVNEIGMISALQHPHLVKLHGCCTEDNQLLLVYEYMENNSLARALFGPDEEQLHLDWPTRHKICIGIARGLAYLHEESRLKIVHRDIKATNVLLDKDLIPKISDFGLAKLDDEGNTHISTRIAGTFGYMAPEYAMRGYLTDKADVYSFGVVLLEVISGRSNTSIRTKDDCSHLLDLANSLKQQGDLMELVDPRLETNFNKDQVLTAINLALLCTNLESAERPNMSAVVSILEGEVAVREFIPNTDTAANKSLLKSTLRSHQNISMDFPWTWTASSASATGDLYPVNLDSAYLERRDSILF